MFHFLLSLNEAISSLVWEKYASSVLFGGLQYAITVMLFLLFTFTVPFYSNAGVGLSNVARRISFVVLDCIDS